MLYIEFSKNKEFIFLRFGKSYGVFFAVRKIVLVDPKPSTQTVCLKYIKWIMIKIQIFKKNKWIKSTGMFKINVCVLLGFQQTL